MNSVTTRQSNPAPACDQNTAGQYSNPATQPPMSGAITGVKNMKIETQESAREACSPRQRSRMIARESTMPEAAANPWKARARTSMARLGEIAARDAAAAYIARPRQRMFLRP